MDVITHIWTGFSIPEWGDNRYLTVDEINAVQKIVAHWGAEWLRLPHDWIQWTLRQAVDNHVRLTLHGKIRELLLENEARKELLLRWVGVRSILRPVYTLNEHIQ